MFEKKDLFSQNINVYLYIMFLSSVRGIIIKIKEKYRVEYRNNMFFNHICLGLIFQ